METINALVWLVGLCTTSTSFLVFAAWKSSMIRFDKLEITLERTVHRVSRLESDNKMTHTFLLDVARRMALLEGCLRSKNLINEE